MSAMAFREPNQVKWMGTRPGHNGTQVLGYGAATVQTLNLWTVSAGKTGYLIAASINTVTNVTGTGRLGIRDVADAVVAILCSNMWTAAGAITGQPWYSWPPIEMPSGYDVFLVASGAGFTALGTVFGWEE